MVDETPPEEPGDNSKPKLTVLPGGRVDKPNRQATSSTSKTSIHVPWKAGHNLVCIVRHAEPGGYEVLIKNKQILGFIKTIEVLKPGSEILAKFLCVHKGRALLNPIFQEHRAPDEDI